MSIIYTKKLILKNSTYLNNIFKNGETLICLLNL